MKISYNWLKDITNTTHTPEELEALLTGCGLEVEGIESFESVKGGLKGIVVGEVKSCQKHPNADKLKITTVNIGGETDLQIVCGAPNVEAGQKVLVAPVGTTVHPIEGEPFEIKKAKIRGELSEGMICAEDELSLGKSHDGILVLPEEYRTGEHATTYFPVYTDYTLEIGLTANRGDAASHLGVARDLKALVNGNLNIKKDPLPSPANTAGTIEVEVKDTDCRRYSGISISGVKVGESPEWIKNRLLTIGIHPINNIVDATNFVLHELGQPLHAFDADKISGKKIVVRKVEEGTTFTTLDKTERRLNGAECMICDSTKPLAIGGVFGGLDSGISANTKHIFIESAYFDASSIRKTAKYHGLSTDASFRYERGTDPEATLQALVRVTNLILEIAGGEVSSEIVDIYPEVISHAPVVFSLPKFTQLIGQEIPLAEVKRILTALDIEISEETDTRLHLLVPPYRSDVKREADIAEEILRIYGLNKIDIPQQLKSTLAKSADENAFILRNKVADYLSNIGFTEMLSNSLTKSAYYTEEELGQAVHMLNPLSSDLDIMRMSMLYNGLEMIQYNRNRKNGDIKAYEYGLTYKTREGGGYEETPHFALYMTGNQTPESWNNAVKPVSYFSLKSVLENFLKRAGLGTLSFDYQTESVFLDMPCEVSYMGTKIATMGEVKADKTAQFDIDEPVYFADIQWNEVKKLAAAVQFYPNQVSPFPAVRRDLALLLDKGVRYADIERIALKSAPKLIRNINAFDVYEGDHIQKGKKSYAISFILQDDQKTLVDQDIDAVMNKLIKGFEKELGAELRG